MRRPNRESIVALLGSQRILLRLACVMFAMLRFLLLGRKCDGFDGDDGDLKIEVQPFGANSI